MQTREQKTLNLSSYGKYKETIIDSAGTRIALSLYENSGPCVIFIPGTMTHPLFYDDFLTALAEKGFSVAGIHPVSHGKSPREKTIYTYADMLQNVLDTVTYCIRNGTDNIVVMGSSQGSILALAAAAADPRIKAVFPHNIFMPALKETIAITRFPGFLKYFQRIFLFSMKIGSALFPGLPIPIGLYLDIDKISSSTEIIDQYLSDPIGLQRYPLAFLCSLFTANMTAATDGSIKCPVVVITSTGDPLFPYSYIQQVFKMIVSPKKEMMVFDEPFHLIFNECVDRIIDPIADKLRQYC